MANILPKISRRHQYIIEQNVDYILGDISNITLEEIIFYKQHKPQVDKSNDIIAKGFQFLVDILGEDYYTHHNRQYRRDTSLCSLLYTICQQFSLYKNETLIEEFIHSFRVQMGIDLMEKGYYKSLNILAEKIKRKPLEEILLRSPDQKQPEYDLDILPEIDMVLKYICLRFRIGLLIISSDKSFRIIKQFPDRHNIILVCSDNKYMALCNHTSDMYLYDTSVVNKIVEELKRTSVEIKGIKEYKVADLKQLADKFGIDVRGKKKEEIYNAICDSLQYKE